MSQIGSFPQIGVKIKNVWNHHLDVYLIYIPNGKYIPWGPSPVQLELESEAAEVMIPSQQILYSRTPINGNDPTQILPP